MSSFNLGYDENMGPGIIRNYQESQIRDIKERFLPFSDQIPLKTSIWMNNESKK